MDTPDTAIKRPARTYGRTRTQMQPPPPPVSHTDDDDSSFSAADASRESIEFSLSSSPGARQPPPDSSDNDLSFLPHDDDADGDDRDASAGEKGILSSFGWKKAVNAMDEENTSPRKINPLVGTIYGKSPSGTTDILAVDQDEHSSSDADLSGEENVAPKAKSSPKTAHKDSMDVSDNETDACDDDEDPFDGPLPALTQSSLSQNGLSSGSSQPHSTLTHTRRRAVVHSSDEDNSDAQQPRPPRDVGRRAKTTANGQAFARSSASPETSPGKLHHINTPTNTSSDNNENEDTPATPPTSQEMPSTAKGKMARERSSKDHGNKETLQEGGSKQPTTESEKSKGKKKEDPLETAVFADGKMKSRKERQAMADKGKDKEQRVKAPTKKELAETQKATARIKASTEATLPRENKTYKLSTLFSKVHEQHKEMARRSISIDPAREPPERDPDSEPIEAFSSSPPRPPPVRTTPALTLPQVQRGRGRSLAHARGRSLTEEPILVSNGLLGLGIGPPPATRGGPAGRGMSMSTGKAREKQRAQQAKAKGKERARTITPVPVPAPTDDVFLALSPPPDRVPDKGKERASFALPAVPSAQTSDGEDEGAREGDNEEDDEMPGVRDIIAETQRKKVVEEKVQRLRAAKLAYLEKQQQERQAAGVEGNESDDDVLVMMDDAHEVAKQEERDRRVAKGKGIRESEGRARQMKYARVKTPVKPRAGAKGRVEGDDEGSLQVLSAVAGPALLKSAHIKSPGLSRASKQMNSKDLNRLLLRASEKQSKEIIQQKEREFYRGSVEALRTDAQVPAKGTFEERLKELVEIGLEKAKKMEEEEDEEDDEWAPEEGGCDDGSSSDPAVDVPVATEDEDEGEQSVQETEHEDGDIDENENAQVPVHASHRHRARVILNSDEEDDADTTARRAPDYGRVLVPDTSAVLEPDDDEDNEAENVSNDDAHVPMIPDELRLLHRRSISLEGTDQGTDKENDALLMFDRGEDKENTAVAPQTLLALLSPTSRARVSAAEERSPLREITHEDDASDATFGQDEDVLGQMSPSVLRSRSLSRGPGLEGSPRGLGTPIRPRGLNPFFARQGSIDLGKDTPKTPAAGTSLLGPAAIIENGGDSGGGLSQFFDESSQPAKKPGAAGPLTLADEDGFSQFMTPAKNGDGFAKLRAPEIDLKLTLDSRPQPVLSLDESVLKQADEIFDKDQELVVGAAIAESSSDHKPRKGQYIDKFGFFTQTAPGPSQKAAGSSPLIITPWMKGADQSLLSSGGPTPLTRRQTARQPSSLRRPFADLVTHAALIGSDEAEDEDEASVQRPGRLRKRTTTPELNGGYRSSPSPSPMKGRTRNAFDVLGKKIKAPQFGVVQPKAKRRLDKNEFIEGEAEESDEDARFTYGLLNKKKEDDDELDGDDQDGILEELVDDAAMDEETLNEEKVFEKVQEHRALDDATDEKIARDAVEGKLRVKRRNRGVDFDSEDSEEEDANLKYRRQKMYKKRRIDGDTLDELAKHNETKAFHDAYYGGEDNDEEFAHLENDDFGSLALGGGEDVDLDGEQDGEEEEEKEVMTAAELRQQLQQAARENNFNVIDPEDVSWADIDHDMDLEEQEDLRIKEVSAVSKMPPPPARMAMESWELPSKLSRGNSAHDVAREQKWARSEGGSRVAGTGRASAVTSLLKSNSSASVSGSRNSVGSVAGRGMAKGKAVAAPQAQAGPSRQVAKLAKAPSTIASMSRRGKFSK